MRIIIFSFLLLTITLVWWGCHKKNIPPNPEEPVTTLPPPPPVPETKLNNSKNDVTMMPFLSIKRTGCYGKCPVYEAIFYENGNVDYIGNRNVEKEGKYSARLEKTALQALKMKISEAKFLEMSDKYPIEGKMIPDLPNTITTIYDGSTIKKQVKNNHNAPESLLILEKYIDAALDGLKWNKITHGE
ncbi:MAG: hypothetical protein KA974_08170 [Saprospiraceae bacterium]|nr:hypothetical protein [Saprospiraceae bacterium]